MNNIPKIELNNDKKAELVAVQEPRVIRARSRLLLDEPWFGTLAMHLRVLVEWKSPTWATDGSNLYWNPEFTSTLTESQLEWLWAHEVLHCALLHPFRRETRIPLLWNYAADFVINAELEKTRLIKIEGCLLDQKYAGLSSEVVYTMLPKDMNIKFVNIGACMDAPNNDGGLPNGQRNGKPQDGRSDGQEQLGEKDWEILIAQATAIAKAAGKLPGGLEEALEASRKPQLNMKDLLKEFITVVGEPSWMRPNRRFIHKDLYLPTAEPTNVEGVCVAVDTSGSMDSHTLSLVFDEIQAICKDCNVENLIVIECDAKIQRVQEYKPGDAIVRSCKGRGGTAFSPVLEYVNNMETAPSCLIYFTDLENSDSSLPEVEIPVIWVVPPSAAKTPVSFGKKVIQENLQ